MKIVGIVPARYASTRFPGKPLALIAGKTLIQHVVERCQQAKALSEVIVATDDTRIWEVAQMRVSSVATMTSERALACWQRSTTCWMRVLPAIRAKGFPGKRVEA